MTDEPRADSEASALSSEEREEMIRDFETTGIATFVMEEEGARYAALQDYVRRNNVPVFTSVDRHEGSVTLTRRPWGSLELT